MSDADPHPSVGAALLQEQISFDEALRISKHELHRSREDQPDHVDNWQSRNQVVLWAAGLSVGILLVLALSAVAAAGTAPLSAVEIIAIAGLALFPGGLFVSFATHGLSFKWQEYVRDLHRLGLDEPQNLPEPPVTSIYRALWERRGGPSFAGQQNIYRDKFEFYYGIGSAADRKPNAMVPGITRACWPIILTIVLATGWTYVFSGVALLGPRDETLDQLIRYTFVGAYGATIYKLVRGYALGGFGSGAYLTGVCRILGCLIAITVIDWLWPGEVVSDTKLALAFMIGFVPVTDVASYLRVALTRLAARSSQRSPSESCSLHELEGLTFWTEARLREEGIEDLQTLVTGNLIDFNLRTGTPIERLVDWIDQAVLHLHIADRTDRLKLRELGIRTATDLEAALRSPKISPDLFQETLPQSSRWLAEVFQTCPNFVHVQHWKQDGAALGSRLRAAGVALGEE